MDKLRFFKENFKKGNLVVSVIENDGRCGIFKFLEDYEEGYNWVDVQRYYLNGEFSPRFVGFNTRSRISGESGTDDYIVIKEY